MADFFKHALFLVWWGQVVGCCRLLVMMAADVYISHVLVSLPSISMWMLCDDSASVVFTCLLYCLVTLGGFAVYLPMKVLSLPYLLMQEEVCEIGKGETVVLS